MEVIMTGDKFRVTSRHLCFLQSHFDDFWKGRTNLHFVFSPAALHDWCRRFSMLLWLHDCAPPLLIQASLVNTITMETVLWQLHWLTGAQAHDHSSTHTMKDTCKYICYKNSRHVQNMQSLDDNWKLFLFSQVDDKCLIQLDDTSNPVTLLVTPYIYHNHYTAVKPHVFHSYHRYY